jgi:glycosyltransferase involved in cell wall biosynthesis
MPEISFFVQTYNTAPYLEECIDSILAQRGNYDYEIILPDDASTDQTEQVARSLTDPRIRYIRHAKNAGAIATANEGYALRTGK